MLSHVEDSDLTWAWTYFGALLLLLDLAFTAGTIVFRHLFRCAEIHNRIFQSLPVVRPGNTFVFILLLQFGMLCVQFGKLGLNSL